jgi:hypothetical protein
MRDRHASKESSAEPDAMLSIFLLDIVGELLEELAAFGAVDEEPIDEPDEDLVSVLMDGFDEEDFISSPAQPAVSRAINATMPVILAIPGLISHSSLLQWTMNKEQRAHNVTYSTPQAKGTHGMPYERPLHPYTLNSYTLVDASICRLRSTLLNCLTFGF